MATTDDIWEDAFARLHANLVTRCREANEAWTKVNTELHKVQPNDEKARLQRRLDGLSAECHELGSIVGTANSLKSLAKAQIAKNVPHAKGVVK